MQRQKRIWEATVAQAELTEDVQKIDVCELQNDGRFSIETAHVSGAIPHHLCAFNGNFRNKWYLYCNLQHECVMSLTNCV